MQKFIRIMAIVAVALVGTSLLLMLISIPFQRLIASDIFGYYDDDVLNLLPLFPFTDFLNCFLRLVCVSLLLFCCFKKKSGISLEFIIFVCLAVVLPIINQFVFYLYQSFIPVTYGIDYRIANNIVSNLLHYCFAPANLGQAIAYAVCGMSVVYKQMNKASE